MQKEWILSSAGSNIAGQNLADELNIPREIAEILIKRGITDRETAEKFFRPNLADLHDPFLMKNMDIAVTRIEEALKNRENILIYGDYDVDGITACSLLFLFLKELTDKVSYFIPERLKEGYGFSRRGVDEAFQKGVTLIITVDCGITACEEVDLAREKGIDVIITDHHEPGAKLPNSYAILNPMVPDCNYPFKGLAGVGVAFKLIQALNKTFGWDVSRLLHFSDLVAIGSSADIVPLVDENRIVVRAGIDRINGRFNIGLNALLDVASLNNCFIGTGQILFGIAPRINAVGRLGSAERAVQLFASTDKNEVYKIANVLESENRQRKMIEEETFLEASEIAESEFDSDKMEPLVLAKNGWHPGVIGIVASRLIDKFFRPAVMIALEDGVGKGSIRSVPDFDVFSALQKCSKYLKEFGGHKYAAGLTIDEDKIPDFKKAFKKSVLESITPDALVPKLNIDGILTLDKITPNFYNILKNFAPFGPQNSRPVFVAQGADVVGRPVIVGKNHLKFSIRQNNAIMPAIGFNLGGHIDRLITERTGIDVAFVVDENTWRGKTTLQLQVKDIR